MDPCELIKLIRTRQKLSQTEFANLIGISQQEVSKLERTQTNLTIKLLSQVSTATKMPIGLLINASSLNLLDDDIIEIITLFSLLSIKDKELYLNLLRCFSTHCIL